MYVIQNVIKTRRDYDLKINDDHGVTLLVFYKATVYGQFSWHEQMKLQNNIPQLVDRHISMSVP